jgi:predicted CoA-binding protein
MNTNTLHCEPVQLKLVGFDGNAWSLMGAFSQAAKKQGRSKEEIKAVMDDCMSSDYNHLLNVLVNHTK